MLDTFKRGDVVITLNQLGDIPPGSVGNVKDIGKEKTLGGSPVLYCTFDGFEGYARCTEDELARPIYMVMQATTAEEMRQEVLDHLRQLKYSCRLMRDKTMRKQQQRVSGEKMLTELIAFYTAVRIQPIEKPDVVFSGFQNDERMIAQMREKTKT